MVEISPGEIGYWLRYHKIHIHQRKPFDLANEPIRKFALWCVL